MLPKISVDQALLKAKSHAKRGEIEEAEKLYQSVLQVFPKNVRAQQGLAALTKPKQNDVTQNPPQEVIDDLLSLYNQGQLAAVVERAQTLTEQYPSAFLFGIPWVPLTWAWVGRKMQPVPVKGCQS
jgi:tetratricopeptide (TPR) repeat protein